MEAKKGSKILGVDFAPLDTPLERRTQTAAVLFWVLTFFLGLPSVLLLWYIFFHTNYAWLSSAYLVHMWYDRKRCNEGGRPVTWVRKLPIWKKYCEYFPIKLVKTTDLDPQKNYLFAYHPHGLMCSGIHGAFSTEGTNFSKVYPGLKPHILTLAQNFSWPLSREYWMAFGTCSSSRESMNHLLSIKGGGHATVLVPGGAPESLENRPGESETRVHLQRRKGFIKVAIQNGVPLVPVYGFGEADLYDQVPNPEGSKLRKFQNWMEKVVGVAPVAVVGRGVFQYTWGLLPRRHPVHVVVGSPVETVKSDNPTQEEIDEVHSKYCEAVMNLFNTHKKLYGYEKHVLKFV